MGTLRTLTSCLLLVIGAVTAQTAPPYTNGRALPQWLTGIIAVSGFLFLAFVSVLVKKAWCDEPSRRNSVESRRNSVELGKENGYARNLDAIRSKENANAYDNLVIENAEDKVTSM